MGADPDLEASIGNVILLQELTDTEPNDNDTGGNFRFFFNRRVFVRSLVVLDTEKAIRVWARIDGRNGAVAFDEKGPITGNRQTGDIVVFATADFVCTRCPESGALAQIDLCIPYCVNDSDGLD